MTLSEFIADPQLPQSRWARWGLVLVLTAVGTLLLRLIRSVAERRLARFAATTANQLDDLLVGLVGRTQGLFLLALSLWGALATVELRPRVERMLHVGIVLAVLVQVGSWGAAALRGFIDLRLRRSSDDPASRTGAGVLVVAGQALVWAAVFLFALDNLGVDITALIAGLGVGGVAVALATQNILGDLFASVSILMDKPFAVGDFVVVGDFMGSVEHIGIKTTRLRSLGGEQLIFSNGDLLQSRIRNYKRMQERRVVFSLGVIYETSPELLEEIPRLIREQIQALPDTRFDRCHFSKYADFALNFETVFYVLSSDYNRYMDLQQQLNLGILRAFKARGIEFAYPTQTLLLQRPVTATAPKKV